MKSVTISADRLAAFADFLQTAGDVQPFDFCTRQEGFIYPRRGEPGVLDLFFFACAHQFGFWLLADDHWARPMVAPLDGRDLKGSDFLWRACTRALQTHPAAWAPATLATRDATALDALFHDGHGRNPLPMWPEHAALIRAYADWFTARDTSPTALVSQANAAAEPLRALLTMLREIPGYAEDPLQKKAMLLAIVLENRPEHFLRVTDPASAVPIIDYHLQRSALRGGLVQVNDPALRAKLVARTLLAPAEEAAIRAATYEVVQQLMTRTGLSAAAIDWFFFQNRTRCPETTAPDCAACPVQAICARETRLFQPVLRTTAY